MNKLIGLIGVAAVLIAGSACAAGPERVVRERFPECFAEPVIGASSGAKCVQNGDEWRITFWSGWGDCPAGCINKEDTAWYKVDAKGRVLQCDSAFTKCAEAGPGEIKKTAAAPVAEPPPAAPDPAGQTYCDAHDECFWFECCETKPMSKRYRDAHAAELSLQQPGRESCDLKCLHELAPPDQRLACVYHSCAAVPKDAPAIDPARPTVWVARSLVVPQCQDPALFLAQPGLAGAPAPIIATLTAPIPAGPEFTKGIDAWEKQQRDGGADNFTCKACDICKTFAREYRLIYFDDLPQYTSGAEAWRRLDQ